MLSSTYQQQSEPRPAELVRDPENRLLWRFNRQRLDFESMRDSVLAVSGSLEPAIGGPSAPWNRQPVLGPAHGLWLHRPPEPRRGLPHV